MAEVKNKDELEESLSSITGNSDAIFVVNSILIVSNLHTIVDTATKLKLPTAAGIGKFKSGLLITYGQDYSASGEKAGRMVRRILNGESPSDLPIETTDFFLGVNLQTAKAIGITIPEDILQQADFIIR